MFNVKFYTQFSKFEFFLQIPLLLFKYVTVVMMIMMVIIIIIN